MKQRPHIGIGILVFKDGHLLLGERIHSHGKGTWSPPGGHLEFGETPEACAARELYEETALEACSFMRGPWTNDYYALDGKHYISLFMMSWKFKGELQNREVEKCSRWEWFPLNELPFPLFPSLLNLLEDFSLTDLAP